MIESKKNNLHLYISQTNKVGNVVVSIGFETNCSASTLRHLKSGCSCNCQTDEKKCFSKGAECTSVCFSLYKVIQNKLAGTPLDVFKSKVGKVCCNFTQGVFYVFWDVQGTVSAVRKSLGMALSCIQPSKVYSIYQDCMRVLQHHSDRNVFNFAADELCKSINSKLVCAVVGKIKADDTKLNAMLDVLSKKLSKLDCEGKKEKPAEYVECVSEHCLVKCSGWASGVLRDYLNFKLKGITISTTDNGLCLNMKEARFDTMKSKLKEGVSDFMNAKFGKVKTDLYPILSYLLLSSGSLDPINVQKLLKDKPSVSEMEKAVSKCL
jgi:hypothetical protein